MKNKEKIFMNIFRKDENNNNKNYTNKITFNLNNLLSKNQNNFQYDEIYIKFLNMLNDFINFFFSYKNFLDNKINENSNEKKENSNEKITNKKNNENYDLFLEKTTEKIKNLEKDSEIIKFLLENLL